MKYSFILLLIIFYYSSFSQTLERKAWMGMRMEPYQQEEVQGLKINSILGGTGAELNLKEGDILLELDALAVTDLASLQNIIKEKVEGNSLTVVIYRDNKKISLTGIYKGRPFETHENSEVIYDAQHYKDGLLRVIINKPFINEKMPALLFIPGYTCSTIDNLSSNHPYKRIIDAFVNAGYVTLRIEKSGIGDSKKTPECESCDLLDEVENFEAGLLKLKSLPYVDTTKIIIFGHSMGGIVAPAITANHNVAGVIVYGTSAKSWFEYIIEMHRVQNHLAGMDPIEHEKSVRDQYDLNYRFYVKKESLEEIAATPEADSILRATWEYDGKGRIFSRNAEYWRQIQDYPHLENWKNTTANVLVQYGESDFQAFSKYDHEQIVNTVNYYHPGNATLMTYPLTDHYFAKSGTMQEAYNKFVNRQIQDLFNEYNFDVGNSAVEWSNSILNYNIKQE